MYENLINLVELKISVQIHWSGFCGIYQTEGNTMPEQLQQGRRGE